MLAAPIPEIPEARADVVAVRIARKLAPLFGIRSEQSPYPMTWVCDYSALTITEIARGAPSPTRRQRAAPPDHRTAQWQIVGRAVTGSDTAGALPNEIANTTLNRFGPDTKAALVLVGANTLLAPVTASVVAALRHVTTATSPDVPLPMRVGAWADMLLDVYRSQPALFTAALQAREVQRAATRRWQLAPAPGRDLARAELATDPGPVLAPREFDIVDGTLSAALGADVQPATTGAIVDRFVDRLAQLGTAASSGHVWLRQADGHRTTAAFVPNDPIVTALVADLERERGCAGLRAEDARRMPSVPTARELAGQDETTRRCVVLVLCSLTRSGFVSGNATGTDEQVLATLDALDDLCAAVLPRDDPAAITVRARVADLRLELVRQNTAFERDVPVVVASLLERLDAAVSRARRGRFERGLAAELVFSGNVELLVVLRQHRERAIHGLPAAADLAVTVRGLWRAALDLLDLDPDRLDAATVSALPIAFHLLNWATFLGRQDDPRDLDAAGDLFTTVVIPSRTKYFERTGDFRPLSHALNNGGGAIDRAAQAAADAGDPARARELSRAARGSVLSALAGPYTVRMLEDADFAATDEASRLALVAMPVLLTCLEFGVSPDRAVDTRRCEILLGLAERHAESFAKNSDGDRYTRADEIMACRTRLEALEERV